MAQDRVNFYVQMREAEYQASLVVDRVRDLVNALDYDKGLMEILSRYEVWTNLRDQFNDFVNAAYIELPDDSG